MIEKTLYGILSQLGISIFPLVIPQEQTAPFVNYLRVKTIPTNTVKGTNRTVDDAHFRIDIWTKDYLKAAEMAEQIIDGLGAAYGPDSLLLDNRDDDEVIIPGLYHRSLLFSLRENRTEGGS